MGNFGLLHHFKRIANWVIKSLLVLSVFSFLCLPPLGFFGFNHEDPKSCAGTWYVRWTVLMREIERRLVCYKFHDKTISNIFEFYWKKVVYFCLWHKVWLNVSNWNLILKYWRIGIVSLIKFPEKNSILIWIDSLKTSKILQFRFFLIEKSKHRSNSSFSFDQVDLWCGTSF